MAQFKTGEVVLTAKFSAFSGSAKDRADYPSHTETYTETFNNIPSVKFLTETVVEPMMGVLVGSTCGATFIDSKTGVRVKVAYSVKARSGNSVTASGVSKENGAAQVARGRKLSKNARRRAARYGK